MMRSARFAGAMCTVYVCALLCVGPALATPIYQAVSAHTSDPCYTAGYVEVYNNGVDYGLNYGKAKIEWHYWYDNASEYWYYAYKVYNNEAGIPADKTDDYHFGHIYGQTSKGSLVYNPINSFDIQFAVDVEIDAYGNQDEVFVLSTNAGGLASDGSGGSPWDDNIDYQYIGATGSWIATGVDWSATRGGAGTLTITPTLWGKGSSPEYNGDTSTFDSGGYQYFQIASTWGPGVISSNVSNGLVSSNAIVVGEVYGPAVEPIPEPATCLIVGFGIVCLSSYRRRRGEMG
ncbi:MAG: hypothetical protein ABIG61_00990 [Planctomycetota bacterium]